MNVYYLQIKPALKIEAKNRQKRKGQIGKLNHVICIILPLKPLPRLQSNTSKVSPAEKWLRKNSF